jgi:hypothetical protein
VSLSSTNSTLQTLFQGNDQFSSKETQISDIGMHEDAPLSHQTVRIPGEEFLREHQVEIFQNDSAQVTNEIPPKRSTCNAVANIDMLYCDK